MKRLLTAGLICISALSASSAAPIVRTGVLDNGLTYYIMRHDEPKGQADFFLSQRIGSVQEKENERGLAHFLEHMAFNGTEHFPGNSLISYLESLGVKFGADLNAYTSTDETVYNICRVPTHRQSSLDSCLLVLRDWSAGLSLNDSDINAERGVIEGEWRHRSAASNRILERLLPTIYPGSLYGKRMPIGLMSVVKNFKPATLRDFYHRWHRPENQAVIVVGDFDPDQMEARVKDMFSTLTNPPSAPRYKETKVPDNKKMIVAIGSDPEQNNNILQLHFKHVAPDLTGEAYWRRKVGESLLGYMLAERFDSLEQSPSCPWQNMAIGISRFLMSRGVNSLILRGTVKNGCEEQAFSAWYAEILRALDYGFTPEEMDMAKTEYMGSLAKRKRNNSYTNSDYARRWSRAFLDGGPLISIESELDSLQSVLDGMTPEYCSSLLAEIADRKGSGRNMVLLAMRPERDDVTPLTAKQMQQAMSKVNEMELVPYSVKAVTGPILAQQVSRGKVVDIDTVPEFDCRLITLDNGVKVYAKKSNLKAGEFFMTGSGPGGFSQKYTEELAPSMKMLNDVMPLCMFGNYTSSQLRRRIAGKDMSVRVSVENTHEGFVLTAGPADREDAFQLLHLKLTDVKPDYNAFAIWQASTSERLASQHSNPVNLMADSIHRNVYRHHPLGMKETPATVAALNLDTIVSLYQDRFSDFSDFTIFVCGDFEWAELTDLLERYVASLPADGRMEQPKDINYGYTQGRNDINFTTPMQTPTAISYSFLTGPAEYTLKNYIVANIAGQILKDRLLKDLREERGWTYSIQGHCSINPDLNAQDAPQFLWPTYIKTAPEHAEATRQAVEEAYQKLALENPDPEEIDRVRSYLLKNFKEGLNDNSFWLSAMRVYQRHGINFASDYESTLNNITPADISAFTKSAVEAHRTRLCLTPQ